MSVHRVLTWLCERPQGDFAVGWVLRRGWPGFASVVLLPKQLNRLQRLPTWHPSHNTAQIRHTQSQLGTIPS